MPAMLPSRPLKWALIALLSLLWTLPSALWAAERHMEVFIDPPGISAAPPVTKTLGVTIKYGTPPYRYEWDMTGDGLADHVTETVEVNLSEVGSSRATVTVWDSAGSVASNSVLLLAMNPMQVQEHYGYLLAVWGCLLSTLLFFLYFLTDGKHVGLGKAAKYAFILTFFALTWSLTFRSIDSDRLPNIHLYEVLQLFGWFALGWCWWATWRFKDARPMAYSAMLVGLVLLYISNFSGDMKDPGIVQPALNSYWRNIHVTAIILAYGGITAAYFASMAYLFRRSKLSDHMAYKSTLFAYPLLTAGIIMGAMWAEEAWGTYWSWDPKETASLVIWLVLTAYLHTRMILGWSGVPSALLSIAGFASMVFCFVGLNFMPGNSLHKYAGAGLGVNSWILLSGFLLFHGFIWVSQRPWAAKREAELRAAEAALDDVSEAGQDRSTLPGLGKARTSAGSVRLP